MCSRCLQEFRSSFRSQIGSWCLWRLDNCWVSYRHVNVLYKEWTNCSSGLVVWVLNTHLVASCLPLQFWRMEQVCAEECLAGIESHCLSFNELKLYPVLLALEPFTFTHHPLSLGNGEMVTYDELRKPILTLSQAHGNHRHCDTLDGCCLLVCIGYEIARLVCTK